MAFNQSNNPHDSELRFEKRSNIKSDFTLFPSFPLDSFLCQTSDPISSRLFSQPEPGPFSMDTMAPPGNSHTENYKAYHLLPSPLCSIIRDPEATSSPVSDNLDYCSSSTTRFNPQSCQSTIHDNPSPNSTRNINSYRRIPYSPESLTSECRYSGSQDTNRTPKVIAGSPGQKLDGPHSAEVYGMNEPPISTAYLPTTFHLEREPTSRHLSSGQAILRSRSNRYIPYISSSHPDGVRAASYDERIRPGNMTRRESPRSSLVVGGDFNHISPPPLPPLPLPLPTLQSRPHGEQQEVESSWSRSWQNISSPDLHTSSSYPSSYPSFEPVPPKGYIPTTYESYSSEMLQLSLRPGDLVTTLNPSPNASIIHCPDCTQKFPTTEQFTKHQQKHQKIYRCRFTDCTRTEGFATPNDRERHEKSVHKIPGFYWRCLEPNCSSYRKEFARRDNLKDHLKRMHATPKGVDEAEANAWRSQMADNGKYEKADTSTPPHQRRD